MGGEGFALRLFAEDTEKVMKEVVTDEARADAVAEIMKNGRDDVETFSKRFEEITKDFREADENQAAGEGARALDDAHLDRFAIVGSPRHAAARLCELAQVGLDFVTIAPGSAVNRTGNSAVFAIVTRPVCRRSGCADTRSGTASA